MIANLYDTRELYNMISFFIYMISI